MLLSRTTVHWSVTIGSSFPNHPSVFFLFKDMGREIKHMKMWYWHPLCIFLRWKRKYWLNLESFLGVQMETLVKTLTYLIHLFTRLTLASYPSQMLWFLTEKNAFSPGGVSVFEWVPGNKQRCACIPLHYTGNLVPPLGCSVAQIQGGKSPYTVSVEENPYYFFMILEIPPVLVVVLTRSWWC